jgi:DNA-binding FadR family transcriptional regulator
VTSLIARDEDRPDGPQPDQHIRDAESLREVTMARVDAASANQWKPLARMRTHEQVIAEIESRLMSGRLRPGDRLPPERQFAEALGVSRGAVREALRILEAIGVVEAGTGSGPSSGSTIIGDGVAGMAMVLRLHLQMASFSQADLLEIRLQIERPAARRAADVATEEDVAALLSLVEGMRGPAAAVDGLEVAFHERVVALAGNGLASVFVGALRRARTPLGGSGFEDGEAGTAAPEVYAAIVAAIADRDGERAAELLAATIPGLRKGIGALKCAG